ncbi:hypothetical protein [Paenibacillus contaminans]|uniref:Uncharacterized protein n=1 Tax=Paenibacillus contaminans TaxID=450362 RepID=A0A329MG30_9BACL|nr:hypothetical protein [Paenibacillus contaminans]RAV18865.1 hypothetical protein DQG23_24360 [Paenibacillus contaminans]
MSRRIQNDEQYDKSAMWLVQKAGELSDPLMPDAEKSELMKKYDFVSAEMQRYRRGELAKEYPGLRKIYAELGWVFNDTPAEPPKVEPAPEPKTQAKKVNLSDFLGEE